MRRSSAVVGGAHPHAQDVGAGLLDHVLRRDGVAERLRHLAAVLVEHEAVGQHHVERRAAARAAAFQQRGMEPAAMLVGAFEIHHRVGAAVDLALDAGELREMHRVFQHEGVRRAGIEPDVADVVDLLPVLVGAACRGSARARRPRTRRRRLRLEGLGDALVRPRGPAGFRPSRPASRATNTAIGTPQARWREITQSGRLSIMPVMRFSPGGGTQRVPLIACSARARSVSSRPCRYRLVHGDEPLRRVAEDDRLLRAPGMRILVLEPAARDQHVRRRSAP